MTDPQPDPGGQPVDQVTQLARKMRLGELDDELREELVDAIAAAESDVEGYLGRSIRPVEKTAARCWAVLGGWEIPDEHAVIREILGATPDTVDGVETGTFTVRYTVGIDYLTDPETRPIRRYVMAAAMNDPVLLQYLAGEKGQHGTIKSISVSTEGQSKTTTWNDLSYGGGGKAGDDAPGALPARSTLDRWRQANRRIVQAPDLGFDARLYRSSGISGVPYRDREGFWNQA